MEWKSSYYDIVYSAVRILQHISLLVIVFLAVMAGIVTALVFRMFVSYQ